MVLLLHLHQVDLAAAAAAVAVVALQAEPLAAAVMRLMALVLGLLELPGPLVRPVLAVLAAPISVSAATAALAAPAVGSQLLVQRAIHSSLRADLEGQPAVRVQAVRQGRRAQPVRQDRQDQQVRKATL